jgi:hypothetical protein
LVAPSSASESGGWRSATRWHCTFWTKRATTSFQFITRTRWPFAGGCRFRLFFTFRQWIGSLLCGLTVWLVLAPLAFRGLKWQRRLAIPVAILAGIGNALGHILSSIYLRRFMPGVYSAPLILLSGIMLLRSALAETSN